MSDFRFFVVGWRNYSIASVQLKRKARVRFKVRGRGFGDNLGTNNSEIWVDTQAMKNIGGSLE